MVGGGVGGPLIFRDVALLSTSAKHVRARGDKTEALKAAGGSSKPSSQEKRERKREEGTRA